MNQSQGDELRNDLKRLLAKWESRKRTITLGVVLQYLREAVAAASRVE